VFLDSFREERTYIDVTITNVLRKTGIAKAAVEMGVTASLAYDNKLEGDGARLCAQRGCTFLAVAAESLGGWHAAAIPIIPQLARQAALHTHSDCKSITTLLFRRLSVAIQRGNARLIRSSPFFSDSFSSQAWDL